MANEMKTKINALDSGTSGKARQPAMRKFFNRAIAPTAIAISALYAFNVSGCGTNNAETKGELAAGAGERRKINVPELQKKTDEMTDRMRRDLNRYLSEKDTAYANALRGLKQEIDSELKKALEPGNDVDIERIRKLQEKMDALKLDKVSRKEIDGMYNTLTRR